MVWTQWFLGVRRSTQLHPNIFYFVKKHVMRLYVSKPNSRFDLKTYSMKATQHHHPHHRRCLWYFCSLLVRCVHSVSLVVYLLNWLSHPSPVPSPFLLSVFCFQIKSNVWNALILCFGTHLMFREASILQGGPPHISAQVDQLVLHKVYRYVLN